MRISVNTSRTLFFVQFCILTKTQHRIGFPRGSTPATYSRGWNRFGLNENIRTLHNGTTRYNKQSLRKGKTGNKHTKAKFSCWKIRYCIGRDGAGRFADFPRRNRTGLWWPQAHIQPSTMSWDNTHDIGKSVRQGTGTDQKITPRMQPTFPSWIRDESIPTKPPTVGQQLTDESCWQPNPLVVKLFNFVV